MDTVMNRIMNKKIENPFNDNQKSFLRLLSKIAKNKNLLGNAGRKYLYEGGIYKELFLKVISLYKIPNLLVVYISPISSLTPFGRLDDI